MSGRTYRYLDPRKLQHEMDIRCLTRQRLAEITGLSYQTIYNIFAGKRCFASTLSKISQALRDYPVDPLASTLVRAA